MVATPAPPMRALIAQLAAAAARRSAAAGATSVGWPAEADFAATMAVLRADYGDATDTGDGTGSDAAQLPLTGVAEVFGLDPVDTALLWLAAAGDLVASVGLAYGQLRNIAGQARPSVALALELAGVPTATLEAFTRLGADAPLRRHRLITLSDSEPWLNRTLAVPDPVLAALAGGTAVDPDVDRLRTPIVPLSLPGSDTIARAIENGAPLVWVRAAAGTSGAAMAAGALAALGLRCLAIDVRRQPVYLGYADVLGAAARAAGLSGCGLLVTGCDAIGETHDRRGFEVLEQAAVPVIAVSSKPWNPAWLPHFPLVVEAGPLSVEDRSSVWKASLGEVVDTDPQLRTTLLGLRLSAEDIAEAARYARLLAAAREEPVGADIVREAAQRIGGSGGATTDRIADITRGRNRPRFADLILPEHVNESLRHLVGWARQRDVVATEGMLRGRGRGIAALFTGNPGTGKTLAAHVIAEELSIELFQVDLSAIVDKYIGETEKNLERVFQAAEALDVVLFFDEADALFGSRSEVHDARDRYANQEVAYLLQRIEHFDGITILSTNLRGNLDRAFSRRMSFIVHFPDPDTATRGRLWRHHVAQLTALDVADPIETDYLAATVELAGGDIRNIVLAAAYDAASADQPVGMRHVVDATRREYRKLGRVVPELEFRPVSR
jgi:DNA polymerase III delta prime subunit